MGMMDRLVEKARRDASKGWVHLTRNGGRYAWELITAPIFLAGVTERGPGVRTLGRPRIDNRGRLVIGGHTLLRSVNVPVELAVGVGASLELGEDVVLNYGVSIGAMGRVRLGNRVRMGPYAMIIDTEFHAVYDRAKRPEPRPVVVEDDVWIGAKASVLPGVTIGRGSIIGVGSVVAADVPPFTVAVGVPARPTRKLDPALFVAGHAEASAER